MTRRTHSLIGRPVLRREDYRFVSGIGQYVDDLSAAAVLHGFTVRSQWSHGKNLHVDVDVARSLPGVRLILTADDLAMAGIACVPVDLPPPGHSFDTWSASPQPVLARDEVRYVGDPIVFIVAETINAARDAAEVLDIQLTELEPVVDVSAARADFSYEEGDGEAVNTAMKAAVSVLSATISVNRVDALPLEARGCVGSYAEGQFTLHVSTQRVQIIQRALADRVFQVPRERMRVVAPDTGGGFGQKNGLYPEYILCLEAARRLGRPVKWTPERSETLSAGCHARDNVFTVSAAVDAAGRITAIDAVRRLNMGAYASSRGMVPVRNGLTHLTGVYGVQAAHVRVEGVLTNTAPTCSYRGAGRPENVYACERLVDLIARSVGQDPIALRRTNLVQPKQMPWISPLGTRFEQHDFEGLLDDALRSIDHGGFAARRARSAKSGRLRGFGVCLFAEDLHGSHEPIKARLEWTGEHLDLIVGTGSAGHSHETTFLQVAADTLAMPMERLEFRQSDTAAMAEGVGTAGSWSMTLGGSSVKLAAEAAIELGRKVAGCILEASTGDIEFDDGLFRITGTDRCVTWEAVFAARPDFRVNGCFDGLGQNVAAACHACEVELDPETGFCTILGYAIVQDSGNVINPSIFEGQLHGGMAQGVGQSWFEQIVYDPASGQLLTGSLADYAIPRASDLPRICTSIRPTPAYDNPLGVKGVGEAAATGAPAALANAVLDALWPLGVTHIDPPFTSEKLWQAIRSTKS